MKNIFIICLIVIACLFSFETYAMSRAPKDGASSFEKDAAWKKVGLSLRMAWQDAMKTGDKNIKLECMLKTTSPITDDNKAVLKAAGLLIGITIKDIATGRVSANDVPNVARLNFIQAIELADPLSQKKKK